MLKITIKIFHPNLILVYQIQKYDNKADDEMSTDGGEKIS